MASVVLVALALLSLAAGALYGTLPAVSDARLRVAERAARDGGRVVRIGPRSRIARAIVAAEDERFFEHGALDPVAIVRVLGSYASGGTVDPGGSTIAQQLARVLYDQPETLLGRLRAIGLAFKLERAYSKEAILSMYLNAIYFGHGFYGVERASEGYFGRRASAIAWAQASLLAGLPQAPAAYDPLEHPAAARARQREVLAQLVERGDLSRAAAGKIARLRLQLRP